jgi:2-polyprenyl-3-methyl-5-hydroxy-6-metoxy-1,4-benzoquinol methylase
MESGKYKLMKTYHIKENYIARLDNKDFDDTKLTDEWQKEVYQYAKKVAEENNFKTILDIGAGSGYKLIKNFDNYSTLGIDIPNTVAFLKEKYPTKSWTDQFVPVTGYDLVISSDVIEHLPDPDILIELIIQCDPKMIVLSTPERNLLYKTDHNGPPFNRSHVREWTMVEFYNYISSRLDVLDHYISNHDQATQVIKATVKGKNNALV